MSTFESMFDRCTQLLMEQFAERDANGDFKQLRYFDPTRPAGSEPYQWPYIISEATFQPVPDQAALEMSLKESLQLNVPTSELVAVGIERLQVDAVIEVNGTEWNIDEATSEWSPELVTFGLLREPLITKNECRAAV